MDAAAITGLVIGGFFVLLLVGLPIFVALGLASLLGLFLMQGVAGFSAVPGVLFDKLNSFVLVAIPLYILMGEVIHVSGIGKDLFTTGEKWLSWLPGGLGMAAIAASALFGAMCGVSLAAAAAIGAVAIPELLNRGYAKSLATGSVAAAGALAVLIPPSVGFILYGIIADESVGKLFIAGIGPGIVLTLLMMGYVGIIAKWRPKMAPRSTEHVSWSERFASLKRLAPALILIILVLGVLYLGIATATESAGVGALGALIIALLRRGCLTWSSFRSVVKKTMSVSGMIMILFATAMLFSYVMTLLQVPQKLSLFLTSLQMPVGIFLILITLFLIVMGMFLDGASLTILVTPMLLPAMEAMGFSRLWFGVFLVLCLETAVITPPVGFNLFTVKAVSPESVTLNDIIRGAQPFVLVEIIAVVIFVLFPAIGLWLPAQMT